MAGAKNVLIFLETSLELVPQEITQHPAILKDAKRRGKRAEELLLDDSKHHAAMKGLKDREKRGRADIIHSSLLLFLDSPVKKYFEIYVHTINDDLIWVNPEVRLPRNYNRFVGLMEDLFKKRVITSGGKKLLEIVDLGLEDILGGKRIVVLREGDYDFPELTPNSAICIGAFPHGDFSNETLSRLEKLGCVYASFGSEAYTTLYVTCKVISLCESLPKC